MAKTTNQSFIYQLGSPCQVQPQAVSVRALAHTCAPARAAHLLLQRAIKVFPSFHTESITED